ncbi:hypothetical protein NGM36_26210 [Streptomyces mutabilis]|uniref:hypothetical protein n=1 Tax=Streptomyces mutabilis TaxID=67332 RepID=UPI0022BA5C3A|nr:hypothetical protein [Streptomyces mutabilis]MCZ9353218.1 hypothetical protein [Streptomyces mutabilis]
MTDHVIPHEQAIANARAVLDQARARRDADRAAGRLDPEAELILRRLEAEQREQEAARAAAIREAAGIWRRGNDALDRMPVADAARACHVPGGPSLAELEQRITADRATRIVTNPPTPPEQRGDGIERPITGR